MCARVSLSLLYCIKQRFSTPVGAKKPHAPISRKHKVVFTKRKAAADDAEAALEIRKLGGEAVLTARSLQEP